MHIRIQLHELNKTINISLCDLFQGENLHPMKNVVFKLFKLVYEIEQRPESWVNTRIVQLYKGKGNSEDLSNHRNIHIKNYLPKAFETGLGFSVVMFDTIFKHSQTIGLQLALQSNNKESIWILSTHMCIDSDLIRGPACE